MSGVVEFNMSDGLPPLVMQKLNSNFKSLGSIDDLSGGKILTGTVMPPNASDGAFFYNTETGDLSVWRNTGEVWEWSSVTDVTRDEWDEEASVQPDPFPDLSDDNPYHNILINSLGILLRSALDVLAALTRSAISFYDGNGNDFENVVASFGVEGAQIGPVNSVHISARADRLSFMSGNQEVAYISVDPDTQKAVFYMTKAMVVEDLQFGEGRWKWYSRSNHNMSLKWMG